MTQERTGREHRTLLELWEKGDKGKETQSPFVVSNRRHSMVYTIKITLWCRQWILPRHEPFCWSRSRSGSRNMARHL